MAPFSETRPNPMIPVAGDYLIDHTLAMLKGAGVNDVTLVVGHKGDCLREHLTDENTDGMSITFIDQGKPAGIGKAIQKAKGSFRPGDHFFLVYSDTLTTANIFSVVYQAHCLRSEPVAAISHARSGEQYGNVYLGADTRITKIIEKPNKKEKLGNYVLSGVFIMTMTLFDLLEKHSGDMEKTLKALVKKEFLRATIWENEWLDLAYPWDILAANRALMDSWGEAVIDQSVHLSGATVKGPVRIAEGVEIMPGTVLEGPAYIGPGSFIGHNVLVRPYTSIGAGSVIGQSTELKNCVLFDKVTVGRLSFIGDSVVGEGANIGSGAMTINHNIDESEVKVKVNGKMKQTGLSKLGAFVGDDAFVGASNTIAAGSIISHGAKIDHNISKLTKR